MKSSALDLPQLLHCKLQERFLGFDRCSHHTPRWLCCFIMLPVGRPFGLRILSCNLARTQQIVYKGRGRRAQGSIKSTRQANGSSKQGWGSCIGVFSSGCAHAIKSRVRHGGVGWGACRPAASRRLRRRQGGAAQGKIVATFGETQVTSPHLSLITSTVTSSVLPMSTACRASSAAIFSQGWPAMRLQVATASSLLRAQHSTAHSRAARSGY